MEVEEDGDEIFTKATHCIKFSCQLGFDTLSRPIYAKLEKKNGFLICTNCGASYGKV